MKVSNVSILLTSALLFVSHIFCICFPLWIVLYTLLLMGLLSKEYDYIM